MNLLIQIMQRTLPMFAKRNTAFTMLMLLLFALASGIANACLLETRTTHSHGIGPSKTTFAPAVMAGHAGAVADHGDDSFTARAPCLKACDERSHALARKDLGVVNADAGPAPVTAVFWPAATPVVAVVRQMGDARPAAPEPPIRVRYQRLAL